MRGVAAGLGSTYDAAMKPVSKDAMATIADVARRAGTSKATVSRVLNRPDTVKPELREAVERAMRELAYVPLGAARSLATKRTRTIGAVVPTVDNAIFARFLDALQSELSEHGMLLLLASSWYEPERELAEVRALVERGVEGIALIGTSRDPATYELLRARDLPCVLGMVCDEALPVNSVGWNNRLEMRKVANFMIDLNHRHLAMVAGITKDNDRARDRVIGAQEAARDRGLTIDPRDIVEARYSIEAGRAGMAQLLRRRPRPTAVMCGNDVLAVAAVLEALSQGLQIPRDISITGFDDLELAANFFPPLTTMHVHADEIGRNAARLLLTHQERGGRPEAVYLRPDLIVRDTTVPPR